MKRLLLIALLFASGIAFAQNESSYDFSAVTASGHRLYYKVVDYGEVYVCVGQHYPELLGGRVVIPRSVKHEGNNYMVTGIAEGTFANCVRLQAVEMPNTLFTIEKRAFYRCTALGDVDMPVSLSSIDESAFEGCCALVDVVIPDGVVEMGARVFKDCTKVRHFVISHNLMAIPEEAFIGCSSVTCWVVPASVTTLGCRCFDGESALREVTLMGDVVAVECELAFPKTVSVSVQPKYFSAYKASYLWGQYNINE